MAPILILKKCLINKINNKSSAINKGKKWKINYKNIKSKKKEQKRTKTPQQFTVFCAVIVTKTIMMMLTIELNLNK